VIKEIIEVFKKKSKDVLIIGDLMLDEYVFGSVKRISPEAPVPIVLEERTEWSLGGAANVALNCKGIGCNVNIIGVVGVNDHWGTRIISMLEANNISTNGIVKSSVRVTTRKKRIMAQNHQLIRTDMEDNFLLTDEEREQVYNNIDLMITSNTIVIISDYAKGVIDKALMQKIITKSCIVLVDPKGPNFSKYLGASYMKPNYKEFEEMCSFFQISVDSFKEKAYKVCEKLELQGIIVTKGEEGITYISREGEEIFSPSVKKDIFDLTGAGDTAISFIAAGLACNISMEQCLTLANQASAIAISKLKTYAVTLDDIVDEYIAPLEKYYTDWSILKNKLNQIKVAGKTVVLTNGCFDILHTGHIHILRESKKQGDILVVALNTDASIKRFKGEGRPVKPLIERANVMAAMSMVDFIVSFDEDTPLEVIKCLKPDILVKGVDYKPEQVVGYDVLKAYGGKVVIIGWKNQHSSTSLIKRLAQSDKILNT